MYGIFNIGATCYMNSLIQCLVHCQSFVTFVAMHAPRHQTSPILTALASILREMGERTTNPLQLATVLQSKLDIEVFTQNDITELMCLFLDHLNREVCSDISAKTMSAIERTPYKDVPYDRHRRRCDEDWGRKVGKEFSDLVPMFYGQQVCQVTCGTCKKLWHNYEVFQQLTLPITQKTLEGCIRDHFGEAQLPEWTCDKCGKGRGSSHQALAHWRNPRILTITLKRFTFTPSGHAVKDSRPIEVPDVLDLGAYTIGKTKTKYALRAFAVHSGSYYGGHYHAVCKGREDSRWRVYDDDTVINLEGGPVGAEHGYVYFYEAV